MVTVYWSNTCWQSRKIQGTALLLLIPTLFACQATGTWLPGISYSLPKRKLLQENKVLGSPGVFVVQLLSFAENPSFKAYLKSPAGRRLFILWRVFLKMTDNLCFSVQRRKKKKKKDFFPSKNHPSPETKSEVSSEGDKGECNFFPQHGPQTALYQQDDAFPHPPFSQSRKRTLQPFLNTLEINKTAMNSTLKND